MEYLHWKEEKIADFSPAATAAMYDRGFVFTRIGKGVMHQTRSCRIDLSKFELSSENRRILKKTDGVSLSGGELPVPSYDIAIGKLSKDFYDAKFGKGIMSAQKVKEMLTEKDKSNFNCLYVYKSASSDTPVGYCICYTNPLMHHYSYPFYDLDKSPKDMGLGMMIRAIEASQKLGHRHIYLGSLQRPGDTYKLQFAGLEWFDGEKWHTDIEAAKAALK